MMAWLLLIAIVLLVLVSILAVGFWSLWKEEKARCERLAKQVLELTEAFSHLLNGKKVELEEQLRADSPTGTQWDYFKTPVR